MIALYRGPAQIPGAAWMPVTDGSALDIRVRWSPDRNLLCFISDRGGFQCIWARRLVPRTKLPAGEPFAVYHMHNPQRSVLSIPDLGLGVTGPAGSRVRQM